MAHTAKRKSSGCAVVMDKKLPFWKFILHHKGLYLMLLPGLLYFIIFRYIPMAGIIIAFQNYSPFKGIFGSRFVGLQNFRNFFKGADFMMLLENTLGISLLSLVLYFPAPIILSLFLNEIRHSATRELYRHLSMYRTLFHGLLWQVSHTSS